MRGYCCGVYIAIDKYLETLAEQIGFRYSYDEIISQGDKGLAQYTWENGWFLICPHESFRIVPVDGHSEVIKDHGPLGKFLKSFMPHNPLGAQLAQNPRDLLAPRTENASICHGSLESLGSSNDPLAFQFSKVPKSKETARWLEQSEPKRRPRPDMIRTQFGTV